jgi:aspartyl-tRNA(Asn)/glutamyl-tRNA(Gln) amidotransferase subunit A
LGGAPLAVKDLFDVAGLPTTAGLVGERKPAARDAEAVRRLRRAGAIPIGKTAMDPLGATTGGQAPGYPPCLNPLDARLSPGGSSAGSAVAVAAGVVPLALGSDTAGSIRIPAAYCGIVGFKPALGPHPSRGTVAIMGPWDLPAILAGSVEACLAGHRALIARALPDAPHGRLRVGVLDDLLADSDRGVAAPIEAVLRRLESDRIAVERTRLDWTARGFGIVLGRRLTQNWGRRAERDPGRFNEVIRGMVELDRAKGRGRYASALAELTAGRRRVARRLGAFDALVCPTVPTAVPAAGSEDVAVSTRFTRLVSALGWPALALPIGLDGRGRPLSLQVTGIPSRLGSVLAVARELERRA